LSNDKAENYVVCEILNKVDKNRILITIDRKAA